MSSNRFCPALCDGFRRRLAARSTAINLAVLKALAVVLSVETTAVTLAASSPGSEASIERAQLAIDRGVGWLVTQQNARDDGWHSSTYGAMGGGASSTALALYVASHLPERYRQLANWKRGLRFLSPGIAKRGCVACPDGTLDYPTYSTALTLTASRRLGLELPAEQRATLVNFLVSAQLTESNDFRPAHTDYGGWDLLGGSGARGITSGTNVSVTFHATEAIAGESHPRRDTVLQLARQWSYRCQNWPDRDGGFFFHPERAAEGNKAQWQGEGFADPRSYGTATCDGLGVMIQAGAEQKAERVKVAVDWLARASSVNEVPGFEDAPEYLGWKEGLKFYYFSSLSRVLPLLPRETRTQRRRDLLKEVLDLQHEDGSWHNESARMREDDPQIATSFALIALSNLLNAERDEAACVVEQARN